MGSQSEQVQSILVHAMGLSAQLLAAFRGSGRREPRQKAGRALHVSWPTLGGSHYDVQVCGGHIGEKKKWNSLNIKQRDRTGDQGCRGIACY